MQLCCARKSQVPTLYSQGREESHCSLAHLSDGDGEGLLAARAVCRLRVVRPLPARRLVREDLQHQRKLRSQWWCRGGVPLLVGARCSLGAAVQHGVEERCDTKPLQAHNLVLLGHKCETQSGSARVGLSFVGTDSDLLGLTVTDTRKISPVGTGSPAPVRAAPPSRRRGAAASRRSSRAACPARPHSRGSAPAARDAPRCCSPASPPALREWNVCVCVCVFVCVCVCVRARLTQLLAAQLVGGAVQLGAARRVGVHVCAQRRQVLVERRQLQLVARRVLLATSRLRLT